MNAHGSGAVCLTDLGGDLWQWTSFSWYDELPPDPILDLESQVVGDAGTDLVPGAAHALVGALGVPAELLAGRRARRALVHVHADVVGRLVAARTHAAETDKHTSPYVTTPQLLLVN